MDSRNRIISNMAFSGNYMTPRLKLDQHNTLTQGNIQNQLYIFNKIDRIHNEQNSEEVIHLVPYMSL